MIINIMSELLPLTVDGPVKYFKVLNMQEKQELLQHHIITEKELKVRIISFHDGNKKVMGYDIDSF